MASASSSSSSSSSPSSTQSVCVIGAGPSGLAMLRAFASKARTKLGLDDATAAAAAAAAAAAGTAGTAGTPADAGASVGDDVDIVRRALDIELVCVDKQEDWGGLWRYEWRAGIDARGEPVHNSMYRYLWSNGPKEALEFADYTFDEHFGRPIASYPPRAVLYDYMRGRVERAGVRRYCRFSSAVQWCEWREDVGKFAVTVCDYTPAANRAAVERQASSGVAPIVADSAPSPAAAAADDAPRVYTALFDRVVVASGHFSTPNVPSFDGFGTFTGRVMHAHDFRDAREFAGKRVLCIGASYSAEDIASQCHKYGAAHVVVSYRSAPLGFDWPRGVEELPLLRSITRDGVATFANDERRTIDAIVLCTGYRHHFPFLEPSLRLATRNAVVAERLYRGVVWPARPQLYYLGMQDQWYTFNMFDVQAWYVRELVIERNAQLATTTSEAMDADTRAWLARQAAVTSARESIVLQGEYIKSLLPDIHDYPLTAAHVDAINERFFAWKAHKAEPNGIMTFRDRRFTSAFTGTLSPAHHTTWLRALDDSLEAYLAVPVDNDEAGGVAQRSDDAEATAAAVASEKQ